MSKTNNVVNIGHNSNQLTDKLIKTLNTLDSARELISSSCLYFERSCKGKMDVFDKKRMDAFEKVEWFQRGDDAQTRGLHNIKESLESIKDYLTSIEVDLDEKK